MMKLANKVVKKLITKKLKISFAESCSGGMLSSSITSISGSSKIFEMGLITYSNQAKINILKIPKQIIKKHGAVSKQCCFSMIKNLSKICKSNIYISITGIAGPNGGTKKKPVGLVYIGVKSGNIVKINKFLFKNKGRISIQRATVRKSLNLILDIIK
tara:strand:- start:94 stop:567 length:474 start_codon:yes stop_codon:yes gene_type:complete